MIRRRRTRRRMMRRRRRRMMRRSNLFQALIDGKHYPGAIRLRETRALVHEMIKTLSARPARRATILIHGTGPDSYACCKSTPDLIQPSHCQLTTASVLQRT
jgi:hypothetical protein